VRARLGNEADSGTARCASSRQSTVP
jgi:hypothetical protein